MPAVSFARRDPAATALYSAADDVPAGDSIVLERRALSTAPEDLPNPRNVCRSSPTMAGGGDLVAFDYPGPADGGRLRKLVDAQVP